MDHNTNRKIILLGFSMGPRLIPNHVQNNTKYQVVAHTRTYANNMLFFNKSLTELVDYTAEDVAALGPDALEDEVDSALAALNEIPGANEGETVEALVEEFREFAAASNTQEVCTSSELSWKRVDVCICLKNHALSIFAKAVSFLIWQVVIMVGYHL